MGVKVRERPEGSGVYWLFINHHGKRKAKKVGDKKLAEKLRARILLGDFNLNSESDAEGLTFKQFAEQWLNEYIYQFRRPKTYSRYNGNLEKHVYPVIGFKQLSMIKRSDVRSLLMGMYKKKFSAAQIESVKSVISGVYEYAKHKELVEVNPTEGATKYLDLSRAKKEKVEPFTQDERDHFLETCKAYFPEVYAFFFCAFRTGMRLGELLGVACGQVDWHSKHINVCRSYNNRKYGPTKTGKSRYVDMTDQLIVVLKECFLSAKKEALKRGVDVFDFPLFHRNGEPFAQNSIRNIFKRILKKAELKKHKVHDTRHTYASLMLSAGISPVYVMEQLGHTSIKMTVDQYGTWIKNDNNKGLVNCLDTPQQSATHTQPNKKKPVTRENYRLIISWWR